MPLRIASTHFLWYNRLTSYPHFPSSFPWRFRDTALASSHSYDDHLLELTTFVLLSMSLAVIVSLLVQDSCKNNKICRFAWKAYEWQPSVL